MQGQWRGDWDWSAIMWIVVGAVVTGATVWAMAVAWWRGEGPPPDEAEGDVSGWGTG